MLLKKSIVTNILLVACAICNITSCTDKDEVSFITNNETGIKESVIFSISNEFNQLKSNKQNILHDETNSLNISVEESNWNIDSSKQLRTSWSGTSTTVTWEAGDAIGTYMRRATGVADFDLDQNNKKYIVSAGTKTVDLVADSSPLYYPVLETDKIDIFAYYPHSQVLQPGDDFISPVYFDTEASTELLRLDYILPADQSGSTVNKCDLMYAVTRDIDKTTSPVVLSFNHALTLFTFKVRSSDFDGVNLTKLSLSGSKVTNSGSLNLNTSALVTKTTSFNPYSIINQQLDGTDYTYIDLIINPCATQNNNAGDQMKLALTVGNTDYTWNIPNNKTFEAGTRYTFTININNTNTNQVDVSVAKGGQVQIGQTVLVGEAIGSFNNNTSSLNATITADAGWVPFKAIYDGVITDLSPTSPTTYTIPQDAANENSLQIIFKPSVWYPADNLLIHYDGIYAGGYEHSYTNTSADNYGVYDNSTWFDLSGNNRTGTLSGFGFNSSSGWVNNGLKFDGGNDKVNYSGIITNSYTMNFVISVDSDNQKQDARIVADGPNYPSFYLIGRANAAESTRKIAVYSVPDAVIQTGAESGYAPVRDQIIQLTMTFDEVTKVLKLYVNGAYTSQITLTNTTPTVSQTIATLGGLANGTIRQIEADYYSFMLYGRVISETEIVNIYNFNRARFGMP